MLSKNRKVDTECRVIQEKWRISYFFVEVNGKPACVICAQQIAVPKEYNVWRHYETNHAEKYNKYSGKMCDDKVVELEISGAMPELQDDEWMQDPAFMVSITEHLNCLNTKMQGRNKLVYDSIHAFEIKLQLWEMQISENNTAHFPTLKSRQAEMAERHDALTKYSSKISNLRMEFQEKFSDFKSLEKDFAINNRLAVRYRFEGEILQC
ncbi:GTD2A protein, partial [Polyodon spathula]|nr:GTD2A protein [Polyodon spathula]